MPEAGATKDPGDLRGDDLQSRLLPNLADDGLGRAFTGVYRASRQAPGAVVAPALEKYSPSLVVDECCYAGVEEKVVPDFLAQPFDVR